MSDTCKEGSGRHATMLPPPKRMDEADPVIPAEGAAVGSAVRMPLAASKELARRREALAERLMLPGLSDDQEPFFQVFHVLVAASLLDVLAVGMPALAAAAVLRGAYDGRIPGGLVLLFGGLLLAGVWRVRRRSLSCAVLRTYREHHELGHRIHCLERLAEREGLL